MALSQSERDLDRRVSRYPLLAWLSARARMIVWVAAGLFFIYYSALMVWQYHHYRVVAFDFGIFDQGLWLLSRGQTPFSTIRGLHIFGDHASFIMILLAPLYRVLPVQEVLLVLSVAVVAVAGPLAYAIARRLGATSILSGVVGLSVTLQPALGWSARDNFHPELFAIPLVLGGFLLLLKERPVWAVALFGIALTVKEDAALLIVPLGLYVLLVMRKRAVGAALVIAGTAAFLLDFLVLLPHFSPTGEVIYGSRYAQLGEGIQGILTGVVTHPGVVGSALIEPKHIGYLAALVAPLPLALLAPRALLIGVPTFMANILSVHAYQSEIRWHYTTYLLVALVIASATGAATLTKRELRVGVIAAEVALFAVVAAQFILSPSPINDGFASPNPPEPYRAMDTMVSMIPEGAVVSAFSPLVPHLSHRVAIYGFPTPFTRHNYGVGEVPELPPVESVEWVAGLTDRYDDMQPMLTELRDSGEFEVVYENPPALLLRRVEPEG